VSHRRHYLHVLSQKIDTTVGIPTEKTSRVDNIEINCSNVL
jgi:hypothetical protein